MVTDKRDSATAIVGSIACRNQSHKNGSMARLLLLSLTAKREAFSMNQSEVARIRRQLEEEYEAMQRGMTGLAVGTARHKFIRARMDRVEGYKQQLKQFVSDAEANEIVGATYVKVMRDESE